MQGHRFAALAHGPTDNGCQTARCFIPDCLGRQTQDRVTVLGSGVDGTVRRIESGYEARGMRERVTSYDGSTPVTGSALPVPSPDATC